MRIGDAAAAAGTTPRALRFYEQRGLLPAPTRTASGQREYSPLEVARVRVIRELLSLGLTVEDVAASAERLQRLVDDRLPAYGTGACTSASGIVENRIAALDARIQRLTHVRDRLAASVAPGGSERSARLAPSPETPR